MTTREVQLYPSTDNFQLTNEESVPWPQASAMLAGIVNGLPVATRGTVRIGGWKGLRLMGTVTLTAQEVKDEKVATLFTALGAATRDGLSGPEIRALIDAAQ